MTVFPAEKPILPQSEDNPWDDPDLAHRYGRFRIRREPERLYGFSLLHKIQSSCIIRWMEMNWHRAESTVYALNPTFDIVPDGDLVPWYHLIIKDEGDGVQSIRFERVEDQKDFEAIRV